MRLYIEYIIVWHGNILELSCIFSEPFLSKVCPLSYVWEWGDGDKRSFSSEFCVIFEGDLQSILCRKMMNHYFDTAKLSQGFLNLLCWEIYYINNVLLHLTRKKTASASPKSCVCTSSFLVIPQTYSSGKLSWLCTLCLSNYACILYFSTQNWSWYFYLAFGLQIRLSLSSSRSVFLPVIVYLFNGFVAPLVKRCKYICIPKYRNTSSVLLYTL